jgi:hypothetical protein
MFSIVDAPTTPSTGRAEAVSTVLAVDTSTAYKGAVSMAVVVDAPMTHAGAHALVMVEDALEVQLLALKNHLSSECSDKLCRGSNVDGFNKRCIGDLCVC